MNKPIHPSATSGAVGAVIYARYSSEHQREASIEDQVRTCKARIEAEGWTLVATYTDYAQSGASHLRPGYQKLLADGRGGAFNVVVAEALDRRWYVVRWNVIASLSGPTWTMSYRRYWVIECSCSRSS
jgi:predicted site-specific integrase-resolvase